MRAVTGEVTSSNPISLSKAAAVITRFSASETGARPDVAAYLKRTAIAFNELVAVHREIRVHRKSPHVEEKEGATHDADNNRWVKKKKKKKKKKGSYYEGEGGNSVPELQGEMGLSSKKKLEGLGEEKSSEERIYWKENKRKEDRLQEIDEVGLVSQSMNTERKKRKHFEQEEVNGEMKKQAGKRKNKSRTIE